MAPFVLWEVEGAQLAPGQSPIPKTVQNSLCSSLGSASAAMAVDVLGAGGALRRLVMLGIPAEGALQPSATALVLDAEEGGRGVWYRMGDGRWEIKTQ